MRKKRKNYTCRVCGRETGHADGYCSKHYDQIKQYGYPLEDSPRRDTDPNEIIIEDDIAKIVLYDMLFEELDEKVFIDIEDVDKISMYNWKRKNGCIVSSEYGKPILLTNFLLDTDDKIEHINGDFLDCRKENLRIIEKNAKVKKVDKRKKGKIEITSLGTSTIDVTGSCWMIEYDKANGQRGCILLENGISQGGTIVEDYNANKRMADYIPYDRAEYILYSHIHGDHFLLSPASISRGFKGKVLMTYEQRVIGEKLLLDACLANN